MADAPKGIGLTPALHRYLVAHGTPPDEIQQALIAKTAELGDIAGMQIAPEQGAFMTLLTRAIGAQRAVEVGTFTGYSALCVARGLPADGRLLCLDVSEEYTDIAKSFWQRAGVADRIELRIGPAAETLAALPETAQFDLGFIDADKGGYARYLELLYPRFHAGGVLLVDNVLWGGSVSDPDARGGQVDAIRAFNDAVARDERWDRAMIPLSDGLTLLRKR